ncbi:MAG: photosynthetic reaction center subunit H [Pseudomonadota bacterium]
MEPFFANFDLASAAIWLFWLFFAGLIYYLQTENMREGYPLEDDDGNPAANQGPFPVPTQKRFDLPHGKDPVRVPTGETEQRPVKLVRSAGQQGQPFLPTGDPMKDGVGPAAWAPRRDAPELTSHGHAKIQPMAKLPSFNVARGRDPRGMTVYSGDKHEVGTCSDLWVDEGEQLVRYLEIDLGRAGKRLAPMGLCRISGRGRGGVVIKSLFANHFKDVPKHRSQSAVTMLEEEKISAYYCGGTLYAGNRADPLV